MTDSLLSSSPSSTLHPNGRLRVTAARVVLSEWTKFRSLRSSVYVVVVALTLMIGMGALFTAITVHQPGGLSDGQGAVSTSLTGTFFAQLAIGVLGILLISGEYGTGMIRSSLTVLPRRLPLLWGKIVVFAGVVLLTMLVASGGAYFLGQAIVRGHGALSSLADPDVLRSVVGAALYVTVAGMTAMALGTLLRNTAAAITTFVAVFFVIPPLTLLLPASWTGHFVPYLPSSIGTVLTGGQTIAGHSLPPWTGFALMCAYCAILIGCAAWRLARKDA